MGCPKVVSEMNIHKREQPPAAKPMRPVPGVAQQSAEIGNDIALVMAAQHGLIGWFNKR